MSHYLRAPKKALGHIQWEREGHPFMRSAPLIAHDTCAKRHGVERDCRKHGEIEFEDLAGRGFDWCWYPGPYGGEHPCYYCGRTA